MSSGSCPACSCDSPWKCCLSSLGLLHSLVGVGLGFLLVQYFGLTNLTYVGWGLVAVGVIGHFVPKKCDHCG